MKNSFTNTKENHQDQKDFQTEKFLLKLQKKFHLKGKTIELMMIYRMKTANLSHLLYNNQNK